MRTNRQETKMMTIVYLRNGKIILGVMMNVQKKVSMRVLHMEMRTVILNKTMNLMSTHKRKIAKNRAQKKIKTTAGIILRIKITITKMAGNSS